MCAFSKEYTDLNQALDELRSVLSRWVEDHSEGPSPEAARYAQLVLHEWIANLLQHGDFSDREPTVKIHLTAEERHVSCSVIDNSKGFDLDAHLPTQHLSMSEGEPDALPERGMGLRIINACTDSLSYSSTEAGRQRFDFFIPADHEPWLSMLF